ncbi:FAD-dependent monooxygenase [Streptomyces sp. Z26]|uniref:FAD-dependent monooxygenase n=1 Tax=Streptomyces sp. Z26 TaxID=2500177 RepID=UPI000EF13AF5|nr:FAD-dependent monooxygenase [Streptomyces sp. Z26]RLL68557.1 pentachlorophenol monooxygenase [Streptomyces sp. Z26]
MSPLNNVKHAGADPAVLVVGAGPTGLALAVDLARRGVPALLLERNAALFPGSRGKGLQPRTLEVLDDLGVVDAVLAAGGPYPPMLGWDGDRPLGAYEMVARPTGPVPGVPYPEGRMLPQWRTQRVLYERLRALGGDVRFGAGLADLAQDAHGVTARLDDGTSVRARWLVAADGGRSTVRALLGVDMTGGAVSDTQVLVADARVDGMSRDHWHVWADAPGGAVACCPLAGTDQFQIVARYGDGARPDTSPAGVRRLVAERTPFAASAVRDVGWVSAFRPRAALADRFRDGRVLLAGDAAHLHTPDGGQGLNTSVQDAYNLGWKLATALADGVAAADAEALVDSYERERRPVAEDVIGLSTRLHRAAEAGRPEGRRRGRETHQLDLGYRDGPLSRDTRRAPGGTLRAGDRAPDAECALAEGARVRLFDAFRGPHWTLLAVGGAPLPPLPPPPGSGPLPVRAYAVTPTEPHAHAAYGTGPALYLVRPDGYVGLATDDPAEVAAYARRYAPPYGPVRASAPAR